MSFCSVIFVAEIKWNNILKRDLTNSHIFHKQQKYIGYPYCVFIFSCDS